MSDDSSLLKIVNNALKNDLDHLRTENRRLVQENLDRQREGAELAEMLAGIREEVTDLVNNKIASLRLLASEVADIHTIADFRLAEHLERKQHAATNAARSVRDIAREKRLLVEKLKILEYQNEYLMQLFPELLEIADKAEIQGVSLEDEDPILAYVGTDEYRTLPEAARNQLALDRYKGRRKSKWEIGRDYERFIGYRFEQAGFRVVYFGIQKKLEDLGRDLIVSREGSVFVVQCKCWAQSKVIHEKHISQLFGTTVKYRIETKNDSAVPLFITTTELSKEAREFAEYLKVNVDERVLFEDYPVIKCNIGKGPDGKESKIYHLPMDQQYDRTTVSRPGEFYATSVSEAESAGFRRALRWHGEKAGTT